MQLFCEDSCGLAGRTYLADNPRYDATRKRKTHQEERVSQLRQALMARTALE